MRGVRAAERSSIGNYLSHVTERPLGSGAYFDAGAWVCCEIDQSVYYDALHDAPQGGVFPARIRSPCPLDHRAQDLVQRGHGRVPGREGGDTRETLRIE